MLKLCNAISPGTETAAWLGLPPLRTGPVVYPRLVGSRNVAEVVHCGSKCSGIKPGDRILTFQSHCSHFFVNSSDVLAVVPDDLDSQSAVKAYLFHLGYSAILASSHSVGAEAAVIGLGVLGLASCAFAEFAAG